MMTLNAKTAATAVQLLWALVTVCPRGSLVEFHYTAGRKASPRAVEECKGHEPEIIRGRLHSVAYNRKGQLYLTVIAENRTPTDGPSAYRRINPLVGTLHALSVLDLGVPA